MQILTDFLDDIVDVAHTRKFWTVVAGAVVYGLSSYFGPEWKYLDEIIWALTALGVYGAKNEE